MCLVIYCYDNNAIPQAAIKLWWQVRLYCYCAGVAEVWLILAGRGRHWLGCLLLLWLVEVSAFPGLSRLCFTAAVLLAGPLILFVEAAKLPEHVLMRTAEIQQRVKIHMSPWGLNSEWAH